jgi:hypothetical protein
MSKTTTPIHETTITVKVYHDPDIIPSLEDWSLADIEYEYTNGSLIAGPVEADTVVLNDADTIEAALVDIGTDGEFFRSWD